MKAEMTVGKIAEVGIDKSSDSEILRNCEGITGLSEAVMPSFW